MTRTPYAGATMVFGTMHGKQDCVAPAFREHLHATVVAADGIDTDQFGTFTGEIARTLTPRDAALSKARLATALTGLPYALASEATYASGFGIGAEHHELLLFHDGRRELTITESTVTLVPFPPVSTVLTPTDALAAAARIGFPDTAVVLTAETADGVNRHKGIVTPEALLDAARALLERAPRVEIGVDCRAHANPARREVLAALATRLARRLATHCPACAAPGWGLVDVRRGLPCAACRLPTTGITADVFGCAACDHRLSHPRSQQSAGPEGCEGCNP